MERDPLQETSQNSFANFNSRAHVERDAELAESKKRSSISTHALTWSATLTEIR